MIPIWKQQTVVSPHREDLCLHLKTRIRGDFFWFYEVQGVDIFLKMAEN